MSVPDRPLRITMICEFYGNGLGFQENLLAKYYRKMGHDVTVITSTFKDVFDYYAGRHDRTDPGGTETVDGARIVRLPFRYNLINKLKSYKGVDKVLADAAPDMIYVHDVTPDFAAVGRYIRANSACRLIMDFHADYINSGNSWLSRKVLHRIIRKSFLDRVRKNISRYYVIIPDGYSFVEDLYLVPREKIGLLPLGADRDLIEGLRQEKPRISIRKRLGIPDDALVLITGGKLERRKRLEVTAEALNYFSDRIHVIVAGKFPPDDQDYRNFVESKLGRAKNRMHFVGWLSPDDMYRHMLAADIAFFPAGRSVIWLQAIGAGLPLIAGGNGADYLDYVNTYGNVIALAPEKVTPSAVAELMNNLDNDRTRVKRMQDGARKVLDETLDWEMLAKRTIEEAFSS